MSGDLAKETREQARRDCETIYSPACPGKGKQLLLSPVQLQISETPRRLNSDYDDTGHYCRRKDFERMYQQPRGNITDQEMLDRAKQQAKEEAQTLDEKDRKDHIDRNGNIIVVVGNPGMGKTTSAKNWVGQSLSRATEGTFLFFIFIRKINFENKMTLLKFLLSSILPHWKHSKESDEDWLQKIVSNGNVVIILDGLDEADVDNFAIEAPSVNVYELADPFHILLNLISGNLLPYARIIVTSRPNQFYSLHFKHRPKFVVEILGLDEEAQNQLILQICPGKHEKIQETLQKNSSVFDYCYVPINFILTILCLMDEDSDADFVSVTKILSSACGKYSRGEQLRGKTPKLADLSKLAYTGFCKRQIVFQREELKQDGFEESTVDSFLNTSLADTSFVFSPTIMEGDKKIYFSHLVWQEFFVAVHLMLIASKDEFKNSLPHLFDDRWEVVSRCLYGFCNSSAMKLLKGATNISCEKTLLKEKRDLLVNEAASYLKKLPHHQIRINNEHETTEGHKVKFQKIQSIFSWIHEANETDISENLVRLIPDHISIESATNILQERTGILPSDISNLLFVTESFLKSWKLEVNGFPFSGNAFERFCSEAPRLNISVGPSFFVAVTFF